MGERQYGVHVIYARVVEAGAGPGAGFAYILYSWYVYLGVRLPLFDALIIYHIYL